MKQREMKKRLLVGAGMLVTVIILSVTFVGIVGMGDIESSFNYSGEDTGTEEYNESLEFVNRIKEREKQNLHKK